MPCVLPAASVVVPVRLRRNAPGRPGESEVRCQPQFLFNKLPKLTMSNCSAMRFAAIVGRFWRIERSISLTHGDRHAERLRILPRLLFKHDTELMNESKPFCWATTFAACAGT